MVVFIVKINFLFTICRRIHWFGFLILFLCLCVILHFAREVSLFPPFCNKSFGRESFDVWGREKPLGRKCFASWIVLKKNKRENWIVRMKMGTKTVLRMTHKGTLLSSTEATPGDEVCTASFAYHVFRCGYRIYTRGYVRPSDGRSVGRSVGPSVGNAFVKIAKSIGKS